MLKLSTHIFSLLISEVTNSGTFKETKNKFFARTIILSMLVFVFLPVFLFAETVPADSGNKTRVLLSDTGQFLTMLEEKKLAGTIFRARLRKIIDTNRAKCPSDFMGLVDELHALSSEIHHAEKKLVALNIKKANLAAAIEKLEEPDPALNSKLDELGIEIFKYEGIVSMLHPEMMAPFEALFMEYVGIECPAGMAILDGEFCMDIYEFPNKKGEAPATGVSFNMAQQLCTLQGKRLCASKEWVRACNGPDCMPHFKAMKGFRASKCNAGTDKFAQPVMEASGALEACVTPDGVADIFGNAWEWTDQVYMERYRMLQGGTQRHDRAAICANTSWGTPESSAPHFGFRCCAEPAIPVPEQEKPEPAVEQVAEDVTVDE